MSRIIYILISTALILGSLLSKADLNYYEEKLQALCSDCSVVIKDFGRIYTSEPSVEDTDSNRIASKEILLSIPNSNLFFNTEVNIQNAALKEISYSALGRELIKKIILRDTYEQKKYPELFPPLIKTRLFFEVPLESGRPNFDKPMWVSERNSVHELHGAFQSNGKQGIIALNNFQNRQNVSYIFIHELYHLLDGNSRIDDDIIDNFLAEYRAILAEVAFHQDFLPYLGNEKFRISKWHNQFLENTEKRVYEKTLNLLYPENPTIIPVAKNSFDYLAERIGSKNKDILFVKVGFSNDSQLLLNKKNENIQKRSHVEKFFEKPENKQLLSPQYLRNLRESGLNQFDPGSGTTRPSDGPGG